MCVGPKKVTKNIPTKSEEILATERWGVGRGRSKRAGKTPSSGKDIDFTNQKKTQDVLNE